MNEIINQYNIQRAQAIQEIVKQDKELSDLLASAPGPHRAAATAATHEMKIIVGPDWTQLLARPADDDEGEEWEDYCFRYEDGKGRFNPIDHGKDWDRLSLETLLDVLALYARARESWLAKLQETSARAASMLADQ